VAKRVALRFGLLFVLLLGGCGKTPPPATLNLPVYFTCDTHGRLEPCGCFTGQLGGLTRLKTVLDHEASAGALRVDVGDAVGGPEDYDLIEYRYILRAFAAMKYDALNIGQREAQFSAAQLEEIKRTSPVPILSANLLNQTNRQPIFDSWRIVQRGAFRIAIIGVLDPNGPGRKPGAGLLVGDMEAAIQRCLGELQGRADLTVLLAFTDEATLARLAREFYECQVILGGKVSQPAQELSRVNRSVIYFVTNESRALGILNLQLATDAPLQVTANEIRLLNEQIPQDEAFRQMMQDYRQEVRHTRLTVDDPNQLGADQIPGVRTAAAFVGTDKCLSCHPSAGEKWTTSAHRYAFKALVDNRADADPKCISCHTVGFGSPSGYRREFGAGQLVNVGCESCHGPGSLHVREREGDTSVHFTFRPLYAGDCQKCHYGEFSRPFDWNQFWPLIEHGKEPRMASTTTPSAP
jgi:hypothetical protein